MTAKLLSKTINKQKETFIAPDCTESRFSAEFEYIFLQTSLLNIDSTSKQGNEIHTFPFLSNEIEGKLCTTK